jgi:EmrB/QacA subfamily drug resistance transporter
MADMKNQSGDETNKGAALLVATTSSFLTPLMGSTVIVALRRIQEAFSLDAVTLSWVSMSVLLAAATFLVPFGRIADIYGRKKIFTYGITLYTLSSLFLGLSPSVAFLISFRVVQGMGAAMIFSTGVAILTSVFPPNERGRALGINVAAVYAGLSLGPPLGGFLTQHFGWQSIFFFNVPLGLITLVTAVWKLKGEWAEARGEKFDLVGSLVYGLSLVAVMYGFSQLPAKTGWWLIIGGVVGLFAFIQWEMRVGSPVLSVRLFRHNAAFSLSNLAALINYSATNAVTFLLSLYLQYIKGFTPQRAGLILIAQPVVMAVLSPLAGRLSDRIEPRVLASLGMAITTAGLVMLIFLNPESGLDYFLLSLGILGFGFALFSSPNTNAIMSSVERKFYGVASATLATMRLTGQMLSQGIALLVFALYIGRVEITPEYYPQFLESARTAFIIFAALCFGGIFASLARGKTHDNS